MSSDNVKTLMTAIDKVKGEMFKMVIAMIFPDDGATSANDHQPQCLNMPDYNGNMPGRVYPSRSGLITCYRETGGYFDGNTAFNGTDKSRGVVLALVWKYETELVSSLT